MVPAVHSYTVVLINYWGRYLLDTPSRLQRQANLDVVLRAEPGARARLPRRKTRVLGSHLVLRRNRISPPSPGDSATCFEQIRRLVRPRAKAKVEPFPPPLLGPFGVPGYHSDPSP
jgi:hypothetical protein